MFLAQAGSGAGDVSWQLVLTIVTGTGVAALALLRWRDNDVKNISKELEAKLNVQYKERFEEQDRRLKALEAKVAHLENGSIAATMKAVEIKATSTEVRTRELAQGIIDDLRMDPAIVAAAVTAIHAVSPP